MSTVVEPKRGADVGRVLVNVRIENLKDRHRVESGELLANQVRAIETGALVDTGATFLCLPAGLITQLGLAYIRTKETKTVQGPVNLRIFGPIWVSVQDRDCIGEAMEIPDGRQILLGQIPLEMMDWWVDCANQKLVGNPEHGGQWMAEI
jgi:predicted aspartyl protease